MVDTSDVGVISGDVRCVGPGVFLIYFNGEDIDKNKNKAPLCGCCV